MDYNNKLEVICLHILAAEVLNKNSDWFDAATIQAFIDSQPVVAEYVAELPQGISTNEILCIILNKLTGKHLLH